MINNEVFIEFVYVMMVGDKFWMKYLLDYYKIDMDIMDCLYRDSYFEFYSFLFLYGVVFKYGYKDILELLWIDNNF